MSTKRGMAFVATVATAPKCTVLSHSTSSPTPAPATHTAIASPVIAELRAIP